MDPIVTAQYGLMAASRRFEESAQRMVGKDPDYAREVVEQTLARIELKASAQVIVAADQMLGDLIDIVA